MSDLLQTIQDQVAKENYGVNAFHHAPDWKQLELWPEVCKRYAFKVAKASLKEASENAEVSNEYFQDAHRSVYFVDQASITNEKNIKL